MTNSELNWRLAKRLAFAISLDIADPSVLVFAWPRAEGDELHWNSIYAATSLSTTAYEMTHEAAEFAYLQLCLRLNKSEVPVVCRAYRETPGPIDPDALAEIAQIEFFHA